MKEVADVSQCGVMSESDKSSPSTRREGRGGAGAAARWRASDSIQHGPVLCMHARSLYSFHGLRRLDLGARAAAQLESMLASTVPVSEKKSAMSSRPWPLAYFILEEGLHIEGGAAHVRLRERQETPAANTCPRCSDSRKTGVVSCPSYPIHSA